MVSHIIIAAFFDGYVLEWIVLPLSAAADADPTRNTMSDQNSVTAVYRNDLARSLPPN
jgi:hypothetical protein